MSAVSTAAERMSCHIGNPMSDLIDNVQSNRVETCLFWFDDATLLLAKICSFSIYTPTAFRQTEDKHLAFYHEFSSGREKPPIRTTVFQSNPRRLTSLILQSILTEEQVMFRCSRRV